MPEVEDKPKDIMDTKPKTEKAPQTKEQEALAKRVQELFQAAYNAKGQLNLAETWKKCDDYKHNRQGDPQDADDPNSVTNIIHPIIEGQIADLVDKPYSTEVQGVEPSDDLYAEQTKYMLEWILSRNRFKAKLNRSEHDRLELGTTIIKVYTDHDALGGRGLPIIEVVSPANFFPDPKVTAHDLLQDGEFNIHAVPKPLSWFRRKFPKMGKYVKAERSVPYDPMIFETEGADEVDTVISQKALLLEAYMKDVDGSIYCVSVANHIVLQDSRDESEDEKAYKVQRKDRFPFVAIPCYVQRGTIWGQGDIELLIPTQDLINELDDQIRINARLMGNPQIVIGMGAGKGFDFRKWTAKPALRIPMRDQNAFRVVEARAVSPDVPMRREKAFDEANIISGRPDVNRGEQPGQITAAAAIMALQQAGQKSVLHKAEMFKVGWGEVLELLYDEMLECWDSEMWVRINGDKPDYKFYDPRKLLNVPMMIPNLTAQENEDTIAPLTDEQGEPMTREAMFDIEFMMGNGLPSDKAFIYQTLIELSKLVIEGKPVISWQELRDYLREQVGIPLNSDELMQPPMPPMGMGPPGTGLPALTPIQGGVMGA